MIKEALLFLVGIVVGGMNAIAGGGMLLGFPVLLAAGLSPLVANITSNIVVLPGQLTSAFGYRRYMRKLPARYLILLIPCLVGAAAGAIVLRHTSSARFQGSGTRLDLVCCPAIYFAAALALPFAPTYSSRRSRSLGVLLIIALALLPTAFYGGYFGAGFGFIMLAFFKLHERCITSTK